MDKPYIGKIEHCHICLEEIKDGKWKISYKDKITCKNCFREVTCTWDTEASTYIAMPEDMKLFLEEIDNVCKKHNLSISHEDSHGGFKICKYDKENIEWLK